MAEQSVKANKVVYLTYSIVNGAGLVVEQHDMPIAYLHGGGSGLIEKIESELEGRRSGEKVEVTLSPEQGFGEHDPNLTFTDEVENVPEDYRYVGAEATFQSEKGEQRTFRVTRIEDGKLTLDGNHPLAGQTVTCVVNIIEVRDATLDEIANGAPAESAATLH